MGTIRNEMTVVHHWKKDALEKVREDAIEVFNQVAEQTGVSILHNEEIVSPIMTTLLNGEYTFIINGDCSKIGWDVSERFHEVRMKWCEKHKNDVQSIVVVNFGQGDEYCQIVFDSKRNRK